MKENLLVVLLLVVGFAIGMYYGTNEIEENKQEYETQIESQIDDSLLFLFFLRNFSIYFNENKKNFLQRKEKDYERYFIERFI